MKRAMVCLLVIAMLLAAGTAHADYKREEYLNGVGRKLWRGVVNTCTGWIELPNQILKGYERGFIKKEYKIVGAFVGIFTGVTHTVGRTLSGVSDLAGFWAADPPNNRGVGIHLDGEYAWYEGTPHSMFDPNFEQATLWPIGRKISRGVGNSVFGFLELPGQIIKGTKESAPDLGIVKGLWYWYSRQVDGAYDICTFLLPNPSDTKGLDFDEKWPWSALGDSIK
ncbi:exosortase system-associated protein, TIGR04073 family [Candidatus Omnitrophota bacterium]